MGMGDKLWIWGRIFSIVLNLLFLRAIARSSVPTNNYLNLYFRREFFFKSSQSELRIAHGSHDFAKLRRNENLFYSTSQTSFLQFCRIKTKWWIHVDDFTYIITAMKQKHFQIKMKSDILSSWIHVNLRTPI